MEITQARFVVSNSDYLKCPPENYPEYAFIGRSNVGKSSLINMLTGRKKLAKISGTPGKTQLINHFIINENWYLVDLPGYGFAKISKSVSAKWEKMIENYLLHRKNLCATFLLIDSRLEPQKSDIDYINWFGEKELNFILLFTKSDKLSKSKLLSNMEKYKQILLEWWDEPPISIATSAKTGTGKAQVLQIIEEMNSGLKK
jgi:GTP-binding protein